MSTTDLYRHFNANDELLYVGISLNAITRLDQHSTRSGWAADIAKITIERHPTRKAALAAEAAAITKERPKFNINGRWCFPLEYDHAEQRALMERAFAKPAPALNLTKGI